MEQTKFRRGDYVKCPYEGREYLGHITESPKNNKAKVKICLSSKKSDPIFEVVDIDVKDLTFPTE